MRGVTSNASVGSIFYTFLQIDPADDPRIRALAMAIRAQTKVRIRFSSKTQQEIHPVAMELNGETWSVKDARTGDWVPIGAWGRLNISAMRF